MRRTLRLGLLALGIVAFIAGCSGGGGGSGVATTRPVGPMHFVALPALPRPFGTLGRLADNDNDDTVIALVDGHLYRYDPWTSGAIWIELGRDLPSAQSRVVSWNDRVWYLTNDRGHLELVSIALSAEVRSDTRAVTGDGAAGYAVVAARDAIYVFGADGGFRVDRDGLYSDFPGPPDRRAVTDWSTERLAELGDGTIVVADDDHLQWIYEPDLARWHDPPSGVQPRDIRSVSVASDGAYLIAGVPPEALRLAASNRLEPLSTALITGCETPELYPSDLGILTVGCGKATLVDAENQSVDVPAGTVVVHGPRGRPVAIRSDTGELLMLQPAQ
jgi:hypothetical protein